MSDIIATLQSILPKGGVLTGEDVTSRSSSWGAFIPNPARAIVRPRTTQEVSQVMAACHAAGQPVVPLGGVTGLVQGGVADKTEIILSLELMTAIESIDPVNRQAVVQCGAPLEAVQNAADEHGLLMPLDLGARGSATIGGTISTNAGGVHVIRFGMMREMVLGLEVVLADGTVVNAMNRVIKNNTGYDLKHVFIGAEGTLGIVTRAVLRLRERPSSVQVGLLASESLEHVTRLLRRADKALSGTLSAFEVMWNDFYRLITSPPAPGRAVLQHTYPYYMIVETMGSDPDADRERFERFLEEAMNEGLIADAVIAKSEAEQNEIWASRDDVGQVLQWGIPFTFDVSLPVSEMDGYVDEIRSGLDTQYPEHKLGIFGHLGDGNLHVIVVADEGSQAARTAVNRIVYGALEGRSGSISAEHGIGLEKKAYLPISRSAEEVAVMRSIKLALDPKNILNPGKIFDV